MIPYIFDYFVMRNEKFHKSLSISVESSVVSLKEL